MKILSLYIDTSVLGGYYDEEFKREAHLLFERIKAGDYAVYLSDVTEAELVNAPQNVQKLLVDLQISYTTLKTNDEAISLAKKYVAEKVVGKSSWEDCLHIALSTISKVDILVSWNFKHIVNIEKIKGYNSINLREGYPVLEIRSPKELLKYED